MKSNPFNIFLKSYSRLCRYHFVAYSGFCQMITNMESSDKLYSCWKCGKKLGSCVLFCDGNGCGIIQAISPDSNYFELLDMPVDFDIDVAELEANFKRKQRLMHPDVFASKSEEEKSASTASSSALNQAYQTLRDPLSRTQYLLTLNGIGALDEGGESLRDSAFLTEMFLLRERVEDMSGREELAAERDRTRARIGSVCGSLGEVVRSGDRARLADLAVQMQYLYKLVEEIEERLD